MVDKKIKAPLTSFDTFNSLLKNSRFFEIEPLGDITNRNHDISGRVIGIRKKVGIFRQTYFILRFLIGIIRILDDSK